MRPYDLYESHKSHESTVVFLSLMSLSEFQESPLVFIIMKNLQSQVVSQSVMSLL